ncbi:diiron oxygenase [Amycolatopsis oliviviridis]|uniref:Membrane protein n=1 Tax=Amycolatopsis oliviviridis TaxID=1471590 RepID=A0ABQ3LWS4_9PSEU|nr:diiron oxygenase [Amycolatopsis oliviviridis]GHH28244.1 membrane protein [Amycolatopsis oliviviridis]
MAPAMRETDREKTAVRLLKSSADKFYDPEVDIDWNASVVEGKGFMLPHRSSLYGTHLWDALSEEQRIELSKHEMAQIAGLGLWLENLVMQMLLKELYDGDPISSHAQYALTEIADECRHSTMFARLTVWMDCPVYGPVPWMRRLAKLLPTLSYGPARYAAILVAEEVLDRIGREQMNAPEIQPLVRMVNRIHVLEEARHVTFARGEVTRGMAKMPKIELAYQQAMAAQISFLVIRSLVNPNLFASVGIRPRDGAKAAWSNPHWHSTIRWAGEKIMPFLLESGLVGKPGMYFWRKSHLLPEGH